MRSLKGKNSLFKHQGSFFQIARRSFADASSEIQGQLVGTMGIFMGERLQQERESPWALTLTDPVPEAFE